MMRCAALGSVFRVQRVCRRHIMQAAGRQFIFGSSSGEKEPTTYEIAMRTVNRERREARGESPIDNAREKHEALEAPEVRQNTGMLTKHKFEQQLARSHSEAKMLRLLAAPLCSAVAHVFPWPLGTVAPGAVEFYSAVIGYAAVPFVFRRNSVFGSTDMFVPKYGFPWDGERMTYAEYSAKYRASSREREKKSEQDSSGSWYDRIKLVLFGLILRWTLGSLVASAINTLAARLAAVPGLKAASCLLVMFAGAIAV